MKTKYIAEFNANNGSTYGRYYYANKKEARKSIREIVKGNVFSGNTGFWSVSNMDNKVLFSGSIRY